MLPIYKADITMYLSFAQCYIYKIQFIFEYSILNN